MPINRSLISLLALLWKHISFRQRQQLVLLLLLMLLVSIVEIVSIGAVFPFLTVLTAPQKIFEHAYFQHGIKLMGLTRPDQLLLPVTAAFCMAVVFAGLMRLLLIWVQTRLSYNIGANVALNVYRRTLYQPYAIHVSRNSSELINGVYSKASGISGYVILPVVTIISSTIIVAAIMVTLVVIDPFTSLIAICGFGLIYALVAKLTHRRLLDNSQLVADEAGKLIKSLQEGLGGIRDVLIGRTQETYCHIFQKADLSMRTAQINSAFIAQSPRFALEALGMLFIALLAYSLARQTDGISRAIPVLGALALGAQRLLPIMQQAFQAWASMRSNQASLSDTLDLLNQPLPAYADYADETPIAFEDSIYLNQVSFRYGPEAGWVLEGVNLRIPKGARMGFIGATGGGKSTLLDIVMGLLEATSGRLEIDGVPIDSGNCRAWQAHIAHVSQMVFLADTSITNNIAFGVPAEQIDHERVRSAARQAQILDTIESWPEKLETQVGERGIRLSGGQRQRIGIARALYKQADVIVFDEATSALDNETEHAVMESIESLGPHVTVLIIAHRLNTLKNCDLIVELAGGQIARSGLRQDLMPNI